MGHKTGSPTVDLWFYWTKVKQSLTKLNFVKINVRRQQAEKIWEMTVTSAQSKDSNTFPVTQASDLETF